MGADGGEMSKHVFKFGDRVTMWGERAVVVTVFDDTGTIGLVRERGGSKIALPEHITPGWPVPEGCARVRAAVAATEDGRYQVWGDSDASSAEMLREVRDLCDHAHIIEADIPLPTARTYRAEVVS